jgi:hypothetical protein
MALRARLPLEAVTTGRRSLRTLPSQPVDAVRCNWVVRTREVPGLLPVRLLRRVAWRR